MAKLKKSPVSSAKKEYKAKERIRKLHKRIDTHKPKPKSPSPGAKMQAAFDEMRKGRPKSPPSRGIPKQYRYAPHPKRNA